jgi:hypothetical protein
MLKCVKKIINLGENSENTNLLNIVPHWGPAVIGGRFPAEDNICSVGLWGMQL